MVETRNKKMRVLLSIAALMLLAVLLGLIFTGMYVGWGPFANLYWKQEARRVKTSYPYETNQGGIVFYGASNFRLWKDMTEDLSTYKVVNCGFGGSTDKLLVEYAEELLYSYNPQLIFFQTGSNDYVGITGSDEEKVAFCMEYKKQMFEAFHEQLPDAKFVVMGGLLLPNRSQYTELTKKINVELEEYCKTQDYIFFVNSEQMTYDGESYRSELFVNDGIHLNHTGQILWRDEYILPMIESLLREYPDLNSVRTDG